MIPFKRRNSVSNQNHTLFLLSHRIVKDRWLDPDDIIFENINTKNKYAVLEDFSRHSKNNFSHWVSEYPADHAPAVWHSISITRESAINKCINHWLKNRDK